MPCQPPCSYNTMQDSAAISDVDVPDFIRRASGSPRAAGVPVQCDTAGDDVV